MTLKEKLLEDMKTAMREKDEIRKNVVTMVRAGVLQFEKDNKATLDDEGVLDVIVKEVKRRKDSLPEYEKSNREDLITTLKAEIDLLMKYLPEQLSEQEVDEIVKQTVAETGLSSIKDMGKVMTAVMAKVKGRTDGKTVNNLVRKYLQ